MKRISRLQWVVRINSETFEPYYDSCCNEGSSPKEAGGEPATRTKTKPVQKKTEKGVVITFLPQEGHWDKKRIQ